MHFIRYVQPLPDIHTHHALPTDTFQTFGLYQDLEDCGEAGMYWDTLLLSCLKNKAFTDRLLIL